MLLLVSLSVSLSVITKYHRPGGKHLLSHGWKMEVHNQSVGRVGFSSVLDLQTFNLLYPQMVLPLCI